MVFRRFWRARGLGLGYGRGLDFGFGLGYGRGLGLGWRRGFRAGFSPYNYPSQPIMQQQPSYATPYSSQYSSYPMQTPYGSQQLYPPKPSTPTTVTAVHMNCAYFNNGVCSLKGTPVPANGSACQSFIPRS
jgi:hypothetical protein